MMDKYIKRIITNHYLQKIYFKKKILFIVKQGEFVIDEKISSDNTIATNAALLKYNQYVMFLKYFSINQILDVFVSVQRIPFFLK